MARRTRYAHYGRLREECRVRLRQFVAAASASEDRLTGLDLPVAPRDKLEILTLRQREFDACHEYVRAYRELADFLQEKAGTERD